MLGGLADQWNPSGTFEKNTESHAGDSPDLKIKRFKVSLFLGFLVSRIIGFLVSRILGFLVSWFQRFLFSWFHSFLVSWLLGFEVSWFLGFKVSNICHFFPFHVFLIDIDLISKIFKISLDVSSGFFGARIFENCQRLGFPNF